MELWFIFAIVSAILAGGSSFYNKISTQRGYNSELLVLYGGLFPIIIYGPVAYIFTNTPTPTTLVLLGLGTGIIAALSALMKLKTLECIDVTIFLPTFKVVAPSCTIIAGLIFFNESFTYLEWTGLILSLLIPLLLISNTEHTRQKNLKRGLFFVLIAGLLSAVMTALLKLGTDLFDAVLVIITMLNIGTFLGSLGVMYLKNTNTRILDTIKEHSSLPLVNASFWRGMMMSTMLLCLTYAYELGGSIGIVYTINSLYILIPIVLSIIIYNEHWNARKVIAIALSIAALALLR